MIATADQKPEAPTNHAKKLGNAPREMVPPNALSSEAREMIMQLNECLGQGDYDHLAELVFELDCNDNLIGQIDFEWYEAQCHSKF